MCVQYTTAAVQQYVREKKSKKADTGGFELTLCLSRIDRSTAEPKGNIFRFVFVKKKIVTFYLEFSVEASISLNFHSFPILIQFNSFFDFFSTF